MDCRPTDKYYPVQRRPVRDLANFTKNVLPYLSRLEEDEAGPDPSEIAQRFGISEERIVMLSRNENPYGPSPSARAALEDAKLHRYPDSRPFVKALSGYSGYPEECLVTGAGMDEIITTICRIFLGPGDTALIPVPTYNFYSVAAELCGAVPAFQSRLPDFSVDAKIPERIKMAFLCSPNNPTGNALSEENVREIVEGTDAIVFLDEAYAEFAQESLLKLVDEYDNLVVGRTLSKAFGLAGLRLGYAVAPAWIAEQYLRVAPLFSISSPSLAAGMAALKDLGWMNECVKKIVAERERMSRILRSAHPSRGNFLYVRTERGSAEVVERLLQRGVIVRDCSSFPGCDKRCLRVTVGRPEENDRFLKEFENAEETLSG
jgi:histidinol-phosphate aminotransferase